MFADFENMPYGTALRVITESIAAFTQVDAVILFGSRARSDNAPTLLPIDCVHLEEAYSDLKAYIT